tara:strand:- start:56 stop:403 length:348 start_codon:yes stop_codon:yes gene_type:complete
LQEAAQVPICKLEAIPDLGSDGFIINSPKGPLNIMIIRQNNKIFIYSNSCPHIGAPLDFSPGDFLNQNKSHIICASHGALFRINDGYCVSGPCEGKSLRPVEFLIRNGEIILVLS